MASSKIKRILSDAGPREAKNELAALFRRICRDKKVGSAEWEYFLTKYLERYGPEVMANSKARSYVKGNLNQQLLGDSMTWRVFMDGLKFLNPARARITVDLQWDDSSITSHHLNIRVRRDPSEGYESLPPMPENIEHGFDETLKSDESSTAGKLKKNGKKKSAESDND